MRRREFLKTAAIASSAVAGGPFVPPAIALSTGASRSRVVIAHDTECFSGSSAVQARVNDMVDHCIMELTGKTSKAAAYEALFPQPVTATTKILIKYNANFNLTSTPSYAKVYNALRTGLTSMLNGTFPAANITATDRAGTAATTNPQFTLGGTTYRIQDVFMNCDYFINLAACWAMGTQYPCGVTMTQKNMMGAISPLNALSNFHSLFTTTSSPALAVLNSQPTFRQKQVLALIDAIAIRTDSGPGGAPNKTAYSIIASKDMVAADYQGLLILKANGLSADREAMARDVFALSAGAPYAIGNADPTLVDVVNIAPPWNTPVIWSGTVPERIGLTVRRIGTSGVRFMLDHGRCAELSIFSMQGELLWRSPTLLWNGETNNGRVAGAGPYAYVLKMGDNTVRGYIVKNQ